MEERTDQSESTPPLRAAAKIADHMSLKDLLVLAIDLAEAGADRLERINGTRDPFACKMRMQIAHLRSAT